MGNNFCKNDCDNLIKKPNKSNQINKSNKANKIINIIKYKKCTKEYNSKNLYKTSPGMPVFTLE